MKHVRGILRKFLYRRYSKQSLILFAVLVISALLGYVWGASSVEIVNTGPWQNEPTYQGIYVQAVANSYAFDKTTPGPGVGQIGNEG